MESDTQISELSSESEDQSPSLLTQRTHWKKRAKPSTPQKMDKGWNPRPQGKASQLHGPLLPVDFSQDLAPQQAGASSTATLRKRKLSTFQDFETSSEQLGPYSNHSVSGEDPLTSASLNKQQKTEVLKAVSSPRNPRLPGIPDTARKKKRDQKAREATMQQVRRWEARMLQEIEDAVHHELNIQADRAFCTEVLVQADGDPHPAQQVISTDLPIQAQGVIDIPLPVQAQRALNIVNTVQADAQDPAALA